MKPQTRHPWRAAPLMCRMHECRGGQGWPGAASIRSAKPQTRHPWRAALASIRSARRAILFLWLALAVPVFASQVSEDPLERQMLEIAKDLRCAVCQNQPVSESNADLARDMRDIIREQLKAGRSREQIVQYFVDRYGDYVLMKPPVQGPGFLVWALPSVIALVLLLSALVYLKHRRRDQLAPPPALSEEDRQRIEQARREIGT